VLNRPFARYTIAVVAVALALVWRLAMVSALHAELPTYLTFYPAVMLVALLAGQWAGLVATALSALVVSYWVLPPVGQFAIEKPADAVGLALFCLMGVFMSVVAERYGRSRERAAAAEKELALQRSKAALAESQQQYRTLFTNMDEGFCIIEMIFDAQGRPADYRFLEVNASFEKQTGLHEAEGKLMRELAPAHEAHWFEIYGKIALTGEPAHFENEARALNRWYDVHAYRVGEPEKRQVAIIFNDISERKRAEEVLRRQADLLRLSFDAIIVWQLDGSIEGWNVGAERLYGFSESEALGRVTHALLRTVHPMPWPEIEAQLRESGHWDGELRHFTKEGREVYVSARKQLIRGADGIERVLETNRDITERKRAEEELQKLNRTLTALSNSNQALMHATDEPAFLQQVCRIINEDCGYAMVWIGFAENDENKTVRPIASAGFEEGYLETMRTPGPTANVGAVPPAPPSALDNRLYAATC
jgi:PAS domain S-box-containing protein